MDAKHFGYWSFRWTDDVFRQGLGAFKSGPCCGISACQAAAKHPFGLGLVFVALYGATYWMFAAGLPSLRSEIDAATYAATLQDLKLGRDDAIPERLKPDGSPIESHHQDFIRGRFDQFYQAIMKDFQVLASKNPNALDVNIGNTASVFLSTLRQIYPVDIAVHEELILSAVIDDQVNGLLEATTKLLHVNV